MLIENAIGGTSLQITRLTHQTIARQASGT